MFFLCQAEDGIRAYKVTGVQTCALPICERAPGPEGIARLRYAETGELIGRRVVKNHMPGPIASGLPDVKADLIRSEERRVGKEWKTMGTRCADQTEI